MEKGKIHVKNEHRGGSAQTQHQQHTTTKAPEGHPASALSPDLKSTPYMGTQHNLEQSQVQSTYYHSPQRPSSKTNPANLSECDTIGNSAHDGVFPLCYVCGGNGGCESLRVFKNPDCPTEPYFPFLERHEPPNGVPRLTATQKYVIACMLCYRSLREQWDSYERKRKHHSQRLYHMKRVDGKSYIGADMQTQGEYAAQVLGLSADHLQHGALQEEFAYLSGVPRTPSHTEYERQPNMGNQYYPLTSQESSTPTSHYAQTNSMPSSTTQQYCDYYNRNFNATLNGQMTPQFTPKDKQTGSTQLPKSVAQGGDEPTFNEQRKSVGGGTAYDALNIKSSSFAHHKFKLGQISYTRNEFSPPNDAQKPANSNNDSKPQQQQQQLQQHQQQQQQSQPTQPATERQSAPQRQILVDTNGQIIGNFLVQHQQQQQQYVPYNVTTLEDLKLFNSAGQLVEPHQQQMQTLLQHGTEQQQQQQQLQQQQQNAAAAAAAGSLPNFPNFSNLMALQQQVLNGAQDLTLTKDPKDIIKVNGQRSIEHSSNSMDSQCGNSNSNTATMPGNNTVGGNSNHAKDMPNAESLDRHGSAGMSLHGRKLDSGSHTPVPPPPTSNASVGMHGVSNSTAPSPLSNSILPPAMTSNDDFSATASPLQRMASITNSLITQPPVPPHHTPPQRPTKAVLPPITQQQFDMFNNLNTEDIVRRVKEALSQYSISQRLFGESVLGLSQGSVSDLLARPKPWHMLTQKGREPFIRMKMFLEDENAVHKLVASQYKIAPEKLMRTGSYSGTPQLPQGLASKIGASLPMQKMMNELKLQEPTQAQHIMQQMQAAAMSAAMQQHQQQAQSQQQHAAAAAVQAAQAAAAAQAAHHQSMLLTSPGLPPQHAISLPPTGAAGGNAGPGTPGSDKKPMMMPIHSPHQANAMRSMHQHMSPTVYEMAALTQDLDTQIITTKIKEALLANNIGQKIFGEAVLGLSQGSVSELLSKPKPWHMLSIKGREPFIRMQLWLSDANNVERLQVIKNERREASKRRRSTGPNQQDNSSDTSSNDTNDFYTSSPGPGSVGSSVSGAPPNKKQRVLFSEEQKQALRLAFELDPYPNVATIEFLANELGLATRTITNWFHNHRMRLKQQVPHNQPGADNPIPSRENTNSTPFDPVQFRILLQQRLLELHKERMGLSGAPTLPYPPYFAAAALLGRSLAGMPGAAAAAAAAAAGAGGEPDLHALNQAFREQMRGLDLSMSSMKRERSVDYDDELDDSHLSDNESLDGADDKSLSGDYKDGASTPRSTPLSAAASYLMGGLAASMRSSSRRKPAAPQWVNPAGPNVTIDANGIMIAGASTAATNATGLPPSAAEQERIINGVCVMQPSDFSRSDEAGEGASTNNNTTGGDVNLEATKRGAEVLEGEFEAQQRFLEPEVRIKQEKEDCDSDNEATTSLPTHEHRPTSEEKLKVISEDKLRMVRVQRHSHEDDASAAAAAPTMTSDVATAGVTTTNTTGMPTTAGGAAGVWNY
uniref:DNA-binding protein SATB n=1 Tax=Ceratitis capitata TaxID=7213 RepID=W8BEJ0_CERCA